MNKEKISWCCRQKSGIEVIDVKDKISENYLKEAEESLDVCSKIEGKWKTISGYYACYNALYSILMKCGIKSEIHDCTIELMDLFGFSEEEKSFLIDLKNKRINCQYYLKEDNVSGIEEIKNFILKCKEILIGLNKDKIDEIRRVIENEI
jgi:uncharacterized protein (UPF0332 family)